MKEMVSGYVCRKGDNITVNINNPNQYQDRISNKNRIKFCLNVKLLLKDENLTVFF